MVWPMGNDFERMIKKHPSSDAYSDVIDEPIIYADTAEWLIAEGHAMAERWRYFALPEEDIEDYPFAWEKEEY